MNLVTDKPGEYPVLWRWMSGQNQLPWSTDLRTIGLIRNDGTIAAAVGYNGWTEKSCFMHVAFDTAHSMTRALLRAAFSYPFIDCSKEAVYALIRQDNEEALRLVRKLGYREIVRTVDDVMFEMKPGECRWLKEQKHGQRVISTAGA